MAMNLVTLWLLTARFKKQLVSYQSILIEFACDCVGFCFTKIYSEVYFLSGEL